MKKHKVLISLSIVLIIFLGCYGLLKWNEYRKTEFIEDTVVALRTLKKEDITKIDIKDKETFTITYKDNMWVEEGFSGIHYNQVLMKKLVDEVIHLQSIQVIRNIQDKTSYGITDHAMTITVYGKNNKNNVFKVGNAATAKQGFYIWDDAKELIYVVPQSSMETILMPKGELIDTAMSLPKNDEIKTFTITNSKEMVSFKRNEQKGYENYETWLMDSPFKSVYQVNTKLITKYTEALQLFSKDKLISHNQDDLGKYGLLEPSLTISINKDLELSFGNEYDGYTYFKWSKEPYVYAIKTSKINMFYELKPFELIRKEIYTPKLQDVASIRMVNPNKTYDVLFKEEMVKQEGVPDKAVVTSQVNGALLDETTTKEIFELISKMTIEAPLVNPGLEQRQERTAEITITYALKDGTSKVLELIPFDPSFYILRMEGNVEFVVSKAPIMTIFNTLSTVIKKDAK